jgi:uncharacterized membrane protein YqjE
MPDLEGIAGTLLAQVRSRVELLAVEWQEEKLNLRKLLLSLMFLLFFLQLAVVLAVMLLLVVYWDRPMRLVIIGAAALLSLLAAAGSAWAFRAALTHRPKPFPATIQELRNDEQSLQRSPS